MAGVQPIARLELHIERHGSAAKTGARRFATLSYIDVGFYDCSVAINVVPVKAGTVIAVFANDPEAPGRSSITFPASGDVGRSNLVPPSSEDGPLLIQLHDYGSPPFMKTGDMGSDHIAYRAAAGKRRGYQGKENTPEEGGTHQLKMRSDWTWASAKVPA